MSSRVVRQIGRRYQSSGTPNVHELLKTPNKYNNKNSAFNFRPNYPKGKGGIFFNPAPSVPTVTKTPNAFLPADDPRKNNPLYNTEVVIPLEYMPELKPRLEKKYHMTKEDIENLQNDREQGLKRKELISKYNISNLFLSLSTDPNVKKLKEREQRIELKKLKWPKSKIEAKEAKAKRVSMWLKDEY